MDDLATNSNHTSPLLARTPRDSAPPFDSSVVDIDVILQSADNVNFYTHKTPLSLASPFFKQMFTLPQAQNGSAQHVEMPTISMSEDSHILRELLLSCRPGYYPTGSLTLEQVRDAMAAAEKYEMTELIPSIGLALISEKFFKESSLQVYAISCRFTLRPQAAEAAYHTLRIPLSERYEFPDLQYVSEDTMKQLEKYFTTCINEARKGVSSHRSSTLWMSVYHSVPVVLTHPVPCCAQGQQRVRVSSAIPPIPVAKWLIKYLEVLRVALGNSPTGATVWKPELSEAALSESCQECQGSVVQEGFHNFKSLLEKDIDEQTALVKLTWKT